MCMDEGIKVIKIYDFPSNYKTFSHFFRRLTHVGVPFQSMGLCEKDTIECNENKAIKSFITQSSDAFSLINRCFIDIDALKKFLFCRPSNQKFSINVVEVITRFSLL